MRRVGQPEGLSAVKGDLSWDEDWRDLSWDDWWAAGNWWTGCSGSGTSCWWEEGWWEPQVGTGKWGVKGAIKGTGKGGGGKKGWKDSAKAADANTGVSNDAGLAAGLLGDAGTIYHSTTGSLPGRSLREGGGVSSGGAPLDRLGVRARQGEQVASHCVRTEDPWMREDPWSRPSSRGRSASRTSRASTEARDAASSRATSEARTASSSRAVSVASVSSRATSEARTASNDSRISDFDDDAALDRAIGSTTKARSGVVRSPLRAGDAVPDFASLEPGPTASSPPNGLQVGRAAGAADEEDTEARLRRLAALRAKRAEEAKRVSEEHMREVDEMLMPCSFDDYIRTVSAALHPGTRKWLFNEVDDWLGGTSRLLVLQGAPGSGKTTFLASLCADRTDVVKASFFCRHDSGDRLLDAKWVVRSLASQLAVHSPKVCNTLLQSGITSEELEEMTERAMLPELLCDPLVAAEAADELPPKIAIVIDGVDECEAHGKTGLRNLIELYFHKLPDRFVFVVSAQSSQLLAGMSPSLEPIMVSLDSDSRHEADLELFSREAVLTGLVPDLELPEAAAELCSWASGLFLNVSLVRPLLARNQMVLGAGTVGASLPSNITGVLQAYLDPLLCMPEPGDAVAASTRALLLAATVAGAPLPVDSISELVGGCPVATVPLAIATLATVFPRIGGCLSSVHHIVHDWLTSESRSAEHAAVLAEAHAALARRCLPILRSVCDAQHMCAAVPDGTPATKYAIAHGLSHVWAAGELMSDEEQIEAQVLLFDARYIRAKCHHCPDEYEAQEHSKAAVLLPSLARPLRLLRSALFVSMEAVRQLPTVHVAEQVWDRAGKAVATRCVGTPQCQPPENPVLTRLTNACVMKQDRLECILTLGPMLEAFREGMVAMLTGHTQWVMALAVYDAPDGMPRLVSGGADHVVRIWSGMEEGYESLRALEGHTDHVRALAPYRLADGTRRLASGSSDNTVRIWDPESEGEAIQVLAGHTDWVRGLVAFTSAAGSAWLASGSSDNTIKVWVTDVDAISEGRVLEGHDRMVMKLVTYTVDGLPRIVSGAADRTIRVWDPQVGGSALRVMEGHKHWVTALEVYNNSVGAPRLASGCVDSAILLWDPEVGGSSLMALEGHMDWVCEITAFEDAEGALRLASSSADRTLRVWDPESGGDGLALLEGHGHWIRGLAAFEGKDGSHRLASGSDDRTIRIWNV